MSSAGWRKGESLEPANEAGGSKPQLNAGNLVLKDEVAHSRTKADHKNIM
jgi:hypothetical protein